MPSWLVIGPDERGRVLAAVARPVARATVSASLTDIKAWAYEHGLPYNPRWSHYTIDAYIAAQYKEPTHATHG